MGKSAVSHLFLSQCVVLVSLAIAVWPFDAGLLEWQCEATSVDQKPSYIFDKIISVVLSVAVAGPLSAAAGTIGQWSGMTTWRYLTIAGLVAVSLLSAIYLAYRLLRPPQDNRPRVADKAARASRAKDEIQSLITQSLEVQSRDDAIQWRDTTITILLGIFGPRIANEFRAAAADIDKSHCDPRKTVGLAKSHLQALAARMHEGMIRSN